MKTSRPLFSRLVIVTFLLMLVALSTPVNASAAPLELTLKPDAPAKPISPDLVGIFFEDLNYAADGGLYAELIQNRSFEYKASERVEWGPLSFWSMVKNGAGEGSLRVGEVRPVHRNNPYYLILTVTEPGEGVGVENSGFDGIPVTAGNAYKASFWGYQPFMNRMWSGDGIEGRPMPVTVQLLGHDGHVLAEQNLQVIGREWTRYEVTLNPDRTDSKARLALMAHAQGGLAIDVVSLFPEDTFKGRPNGLRKDLAQKLADLHPKFVRFPGGCLVHGQGLYHYYDWKNSVGPVEQRKEQRNLWGYHQTLGLGYYEFFQFCEDIGAMPLPVVAAGVSCQHSGDSPGVGQEGLPMDEMLGYIQDILDLIEWANGPADSEWGSVRAAAGHPEPFDLKYLGVGNEDAITPVFEERFRMIYDVLSEKHPEIVVIGTVGPFASGEDYDKGWKFSNKLDLEMVDEHYYVKPQWFWDNLERYDAYDRSKAAVYVGEYAAHEPDRSNTLRSALAEAAGLTGFERNADIVTFASYAPLLARRGHTQWRPDMIYFTGTDICLTPNYYVQQLFGQNGGDKLIEAELLGKESSDKLAYSVVRNTDTSELILKIVNGNADSIPLSIAIEGMDETKNYRATRFLLTGPSLDAINEEGVPEVIHPVKSDFTICSRFDYEVPAQSLTVLRWSD